MRIQTKRGVTKILAVIIGVFPFYAFAILDKVMNDPELSINALFLFYLPITALFLSILLLLNKYLLKQKNSDYNAFQQSYLLDVAIVLLLLIGTSFINTIANLFLKDLFPTQIGNSKALDVLNSIFSNWYYAILFLIPFTWVSQIFLVFSKIFLWKNIWDISSNRIWPWLVIICSCIFFSLTDIDKGILGLLVAFAINMLYGITYFYYRRYLPLIITSVLFQTIQMLDFWISYPK